MTARFDTRWRRMDSDSSEPRLVSVNLDRLYKGSRRHEQWSRVAPGVTWRELRALGISARDIRVLVANGVAGFDRPLPRDMRADWGMQAPNRQRPAPRPAPTPRPRAPRPRAPRPMLVPYAGKDSGGLGGEDAGSAEPATQPRKCLKCLNMFPSHGPGNRICPDCTPLVNKLAAATPFEDLS